MSLNPFTTEILENHPKLTLEIIDSLPPKEIVALLRRAAPSLALRILIPLSHWKCAQVFSLLPKTTSVEIMNRASTDESILILKKLPKSMHTELLGALAVDKRQPLKALLSYPEDSVGAWMNPAPLSVLPESTVNDVLSNLQVVKGSLSVKILNVYIIDQKNNLKGTLSISELLQVDPESSVRKIMKKKVKILTPYQPLGLAASFEEWREFSSLPVIDPDAGLIGELTHSNLRRAQDSIKPKKEDRGRERPNLLWEGLEAGDAFVSGIIDLLPKMREED